MYQIDKHILEEFYAKGLSQEAIGNALGVSQWVISKRMQTYGITTRAKTHKLDMHRRKWTFDNTVLDEVIPKGAWVLGWLLSDGYVSPKGNYFCLHLARQDEEVLHLIKDFFKYNGKIYSSKNKIKGKSYDQVLLRIHSEYLCARLKEFGIYSGKTNAEKFPDKLISCTEEIHRCFIRGIFEGDGSILLGNGKSAVFQIVGTWELLNAIQRLLIGYLSISKTKFTRNIKNRNHYALRYRGIVYPFRIFAWIYKNANFYLTRKYKKYQELLQRN